MRNGRPWSDFDAAKETIRLHGVSGELKVEAHYEEYRDDRDKEDRHALQGPTGLAASRRSTNDAAALYFPPVSGADIAPRTTAEKSATGVHMAVRTDDQHRTLMATQLANAATGYNWVAKATPVGPMVQQRGGKPWTGATQGGAFKLAAVQCRQGKTGSTACRHDGTGRTVWSCVGRPECLGRVGVPVRSQQTGAAEDAKDITDEPLSPSTCRSDRKTCRFITWIELHTAKHSFRLRRDLRRELGTTHRAGWIAIENTKAKEVLFFSAWSGRAIGKWN